MYIIERICFFSAPLRGTAYKRQRLTQWFVIVKHRSPPGHPYTMWTTQYTFGELARNFSAVFFPLICIPTTNIPTFYFWCHPNCNSTAPHPVATPSPSPPFIFLHPDLTSDLWFYPNPCLNVFWTSEPPPMGYRMLAVAFWFSPHYPVLGFFFFLIFKYNINAFNNSHSLSSFT